MSKNAEEIVDMNDRSNDEQYYKEHPIASSQPTMIFSGNYGHTLFAHTTEEPVLEEEHDNSVDENISASSKIIMDRGK